MIYYNPYKNIFRAFFNAIRVFISSLFSKRLLLMIIVALVIMLLHLNVNATTYADGWTYRQTTLPVYNAETDKYDIDYRIYNQNGIHEGTISIPSNIYNGNNFFLMMNNNNQFVIYQYTYSNINTYYFYYQNNYYKLTNDINAIAKNFRVDRSRIYTYNESTDNWDILNRNDNNYWISNKNEVNPNSIIYANCSVNYYLSSSAYTTQDLLINYKVFRNPQIQLLQNEGFRIYLNDFINYSNNESEYETINQYLQSIICNVYDKNNNSYVTYNTNVLNVTDIQEDEENGYYVDITFEDFFTYMNKFDSDYIITFTPNLNTLIHKTAYGNNYLFDFSTIFTCNVNVRYIYYANLGAGVLRIVDDEGNLIDGEKPIPTEQELAQQLAQEEAERKEQEKEQARLDAINGVTNAIDNSTNSILSTDADEITMNDFGVSSPSIEGSPDLTNIFELIYNSFMQVYEEDIYHIEFGLPFVDDTFNYDIPANALRSKLPDTLVNLIAVFWWVVLGGFVISFIVKIIHQIVTYSNGSVDGSSGGGFLSELTMTPTEFVLFNILH